jgi:hypothetical protein
VLKKPFSLEEVQRTALRAADVRPTPRYRPVDAPYRAT